MILLFNKESGAALFKLAVSTLGQLG